MLSSGTSYNQGRQQETRAPSPSPFSNDPKRSALQPGGTPTGRLAVRGGIGFAASPRLAPKTTASTLAPSRGPASSRPSFSPGASPQMLRAQPYQAGQPTVGGKEWTAGGQSTAMSPQPRFDSVKQKEFQEKIDQVCGCL